MLPYTNSNIFRLKEKVFCRYKKYIYEAICEKTGIVDGTYQYFIHYCGWGTEWDEWVTSDRLLKYNRENYRHFTEQERKYELGLLASARQKNATNKARINSRRKAAASKQPLAKPPTPKRPPNQPPVRMASNEKATRNRIERTCKMKPIYYGPVKF